VAAVAMLQSAILIDAKLDQTNLEDAQLQGARLGGVDLSGTPESRERGSPRSARRRRHKVAERLRLAHSWGETRLTRAGLPSKSWKLLTQLPSAIPSVISVQIGRASCVFLLLCQAAAGWRQRWRQSNSARSGSRPPPWTMQRVAPRVPNPLATPGAPVRPITRTLQIAKLNGLPEPAAAPGRHGNHVGLWPG
jgi:Pentapeptide repeats (8 copies)